MLPRRPPAGERDWSEGVNADSLAEFLHECRSVPAEEIRPHLYEYRNGAAVKHLFRVVASLDSLIVGEQQIAGQVKRAYELARDQGTAGPLLHALFQHARVVARRVRNETGITQGHVSVSSRGRGLRAPGVLRFQGQDHSGHRRGQDG